SLAVQKIDPNGILLWGPNGVVINVADEHAPRVTATSDGYYVVGWISGSTSVMQKYDASGVAQWGAGITIAEASHQVSLADLEPGDNGSVIALWIRCGSTNCILSNKFLYTQKYDSAGIPQWNGGSPRILFDGTSVQNGYFPTFLPDGS